MAWAYYNEFDAYPAQWLRNLIAAGHLPDGEVDERSITDVSGDDLRGFGECHFFAGIGGWPLALKLAGWPEDRKVWTGSCPCQPLSVAGQQQGHADERHLWPAFHALIAERKPATVFGEQVGGKLGYEWLAGIRADLEASGYACGAADIPAAGVGAPHIRQRLWWVADAANERHERHRHSRRGRRGPENDGGAVCGMGDADDTRPQGRHGGRHGADERASGQAGMANAWADAEWLPCADGKARRIKSGISPLVDELPRAVDGLGPISRVGTLRAAGNAIVPACAQAFIEAFLECRP